MNKKITQLVPTFEHWHLGPGLASRRVAHSVTRVGGTCSEGRILERSCSNTRSCQAVRLLSAAGSQLSSAPAPGPQQAWTASFGSCLCLARSLVPGGVSEGSEQTQQRRVHSGNSVGFSVSAWACWTETQPEQGSKLETV